MDKDSIKKAAITAALEGGRVARKYFEQGFEVRAKDTANLVTDADLETEKAIAAVLNDFFPEHNLLGEELHREQTAGKPLWIIDPIDGTANFAHNNPHFAVSIAFHDGSNPHTGVVYNPITEELFFAQKGCGASYNEKPVSVSKVPSIDQALVAVGFYYNREESLDHTIAIIQELFAKDIHGIRRNGTASLDLCYVGCGRFDAYFELMLSPWDFAAGALFVEEAGGKVTATSGELLGIEASGVLSSNGLLHSELLADIRKRLAEA